HDLFFDGVQLLECARDHFAELGHKLIAPLRAAHSRVAGPGRINPVCHGNLLVFLPTLDSSPPDVSGGSLRSQSRVMSSSNSLWPRYCSSRRRKAAASFTSVESCKVSAAGSAETAVA